MDIITILLTINIVSVVVFTGAMLQIAWQKYTSARRARTVINRQAIIRLSLSKYIRESIGDIHVGYCKSSGQTVPGIYAHAHNDGTGDVCLFDMLPLKPAFLEWTLAHECAHLVAGRAGCYNHDRTWKNAIRMIGYAEEGESFQGDLRTRQPDYRTGVNPNYRRLATLVMEQVELARPSHIDMARAYAEKLTTTLSAHIRRSAA